MPPKGKKKHPILTKKVEERIASLTFEATYNQLKDIIKDSVEGGQLDEAISAINDSLNMTSITERQFACEVVKAECYKKFDKLPDAIKVANAVYGRGCRVASVRELVGRGHLIEGDHATARTFFDPLYGELEDTDPLKGELEQILNEIKEKEEKEKGGKEKKKGRVRRAPQL